MPSPERPKGKGGSGRQQKDLGKKAGAGKKRVRATAVERAKELFPEEEIAGLAPRPLPVSQKTAELGEAGRTGVSKQALKFVLGVLLLPVAFILTGGFLGTLKQADLTKGIAQTHSIHDLLNNLNSLQYLAAGMLLFVILFAVAPRKILMLAYVLGHEVTHALWVKLFGGKVADRFHVSLEGGHVLTDRVNTWIVLSPYFFPIYSILAGTLYGVLLLAGGVIDLMNGTGGLYAAIASFQWLFMVVIGCTLAFHLTFTFLLVTKSQPDLHYGGTFFSLMMIYVLNLLLITGLFLVTSNKVLWEIYVDRLHDAEEFLIQRCAQLWEWIIQGVEYLNAAFGR